MKVRFCRAVFLFAFAVVFLFISGQTFPADEETSPESEAPKVEKSTLKTKEERLRELQLEKAELTLRQREIALKEKKADYENMNALFGKGVVPAQERNDAREDMEGAQLQYDQAKLDLQTAELESLKAAWHITIDSDDTRVFDVGDKKYLEITIENTSEKVKLERTQRMIDEKIIEPVETEVNPEINDIYVSIKEGESIISKPYEIYIDSLKLGEPRLLKFELIKDVENVIISLRYEDQEDQRNIHLKKVEPYISVVKAVKYRTDDDERMLYVVLRNGAEERKGESVKAAGKPEPSDPGKSSSTTSTSSDIIEVEDSDLNDINNIYVSIKDEQRNIIGIPYEIRIPTLKLDEEKGYKFELQKDVNSVIISMNFAKKEDNKTVYLEPDTRHISIKSAKVRVLGNTSDIDPERRGKKEVTLELINRSETGKMPFEEELEEISGSSIGATSEIRHVFVSLNHRGVVVAQPYEAVIDRLEYDKPKPLTFVLQQTEIDEVTVSLSYLGRSEEQQVYLEKVSPEDIVIVTSVQFAQEGTLGNSVSYDLALERPAEMERVFKLRVGNLSDQFTYEFNDPQSSARVTQIKFTHAQSRRELSLRVFLPEEMDFSLLDQPMDFYAAVLSEDEDVNFEPGRLTLALNELDQVKSKVKLVLTPKGEPEFELIAQNLYFEIKTGEPVEMLLELKNTGTRNLENIRITTELPSNKWNSEIQPDLVKKLDREQEEDIKITIIPPLDVGVGDTEVKINAECEVDNRPIEAPEKNVRIHISGRANIMGSVILIGALILLVIGIAVLTIKLSRR